MSEKHVQSVSYDLQGETHTNYVLGEKSVSILKESFTADCPLEDSVYGSDDDFWKAIAWCESLGINTIDLTYERDGRRNRYSATWRGANRAEMFMRWLIKLHDFEYSTIHDGVFLD